MSESDDTARHTASAINLAVHGLRPLSSPAQHAVALGIGLWYAHLLHRAQTSGKYIVAEFSPEEREHLTADDMKFYDAERIRWNE